MSGSSWDNAATIGSLDKMVRLVGAGGTVLMQADAGAYALSSSITISSGGADGAPVTIKGVNKAGAEQNIVINGTRPEVFDPINPAGNEVFRLSGKASNLVFENMSFNNVKTAFHPTSDLTNLTIKDMTANNVERFFDDLAGGAAKTATLSGVTIQNVDVTNFSKGVVRLMYDTSNVLIDDVHGSGGLDGSNFAIGVHIDGTAHDVVVKNSSMGNITDTTNYYWNGDGFATEGGVYNVTFQNTRAYGNTDAGYDLKSASTVLIDTVAEDNKRNYRLWGEETLINATGKNPHLRGGSGDQLQVQVLGSANVKIIGGTFTDAGNGTAVFKLEGGVLDVSKASIVHAAGAQVFNIANGASTVTSNGLKVANVDGVIGWSNGYSATGVKLGALTDNILVKAIAGNEVFVGTSVAETFLFDTAKGKAFGADTIRNFGSEDRIVTTTKLSDPNGDSKIMANGSDHFALPGSSDNGTFKVFLPTGKATQQLTLLDTVMEDGVAHYVYGATGATGTSAPTIKLLLEETKALADKAAALLPKVANSLPAALATAPVKQAPIGAFEGTAGNDMLRGTAAKDLFFFDTAKGATGVDIIRNFGSGDRLVTTSKLPDPNDDGKISFNKSDKLALTDAGGADLGTLKMSYESGKAVSNIDLVGTVVDHGQTYYVYGGHGDMAPGAALLFG